MVRRPMSVFGLEGEGEMANIRFSGGATQKMEVGRDGKTAYERGRGKPRMLLAVEFVLVVWETWKQGARDGEAFAIDQFGGRSADVWFKRSPDG